MATKDKDGLFSKKKQLFAGTDSFGNDKNKQFLNLNLNQNDKVSDGFLSHSTKSDGLSSFGQTFSKSNNGKSFGYTVKDDFQEKGKSWNKSMKDYKTLTSNSETEKDKNQKLWKNESSNKKNSSTLSLHIAAYENSLDAPTAEAKVDIAIKSDALKSIVVLTEFKDPFEFPRQMEDKDSATPEVQQFTASQKLFTPNQENSINQMSPSSLQSSKMESYSLSKVHLLDEMEFMKNGQFNAVNFKAYLNEMPDSFVFDQRFLCSMVEALKTVCQLDDQEKKDQLLLIFQDLFNRLENYGDAVITYFDSCKDFDHGPLDVHNFVIGVDIKEIEKHCCNGNELNFENTTVSAKLLAWSLIGNTSNCLNHFLSQSVIMPATVMRFLRCVFEHLPEVFNYNAQYKNLRGSLLLVTLCNIINRYSETPEGLKTIQQIIVKMACPNIKGQLPLLDPNVLLEKILQRLVANDMQDFWIQLFADFLRHLKKSNIQMVWDSECGDIRNPVILSVILMKILSTQKLEGFDPAETFKNLGILFKAHGFEFKDASAFGGCDEMDWCMKFALLDFLQVPSTSYRREVPSALYHALSTECKNKYVELDDTRPTLESYLKGIFELAFVADEIPVEFIEGAAAKYTEEFELTNYIATCFYQAFSNVLPVRNIQMRESIFKVIKTMLEIFDCKIDLGENFYTTGLIKVILNMQHCLLIGKAALAGILSYKSSLSSRNPTVDFRKLDTASQRLLGIFVELANTFCSGYQNDLCIALDKNEYTISRTKLSAMNSVYALLKESTDSFTKYLENPPQDLKVFVTRLANFHQLYLEYVQKGDSFMNPSKLSETISSAIAVQHEYLGESLAKLDDQIQSPYVPSPEALRHSSRPLHRQSASTQISRSIYSSQTISNQQHRESRQPQSTVVSATPDPRPNESQSTVECAPLQKKPRFTTPRTDHLQSVYDDAIKNFELNNLYDADISTPNIPVNLSKDSQNALNQESYNPKTSEKPFATTSHNGIDRIDYGKMTKNVEVKPAEFSRSFASSFSSSEAFVEFDYELSSKQSKSSSVQAVASNESQQSVSDQPSVQNAVGFDKMKTKDTSTEALKRNESEKNKIYQAEIDQKQSEVISPSKQAFSNEPKTADERSVEQNVSGYEKESNQIPAFLRNEKRFTGAAAVLKGVSKDKYSLKTVEINPSQPAPVNPVYRMPVQEYYGQPLNVVGFGQQLSNFQPRPQSTGIQRQPFSLFNQSFPRSNIENLQNFGNQPRQSNDSKIKSYVEACLAKAGPPPQIKRINLADYPKEYVTRSCDRQK